MNQNLKKHACNECYFSTSRMFNLERHFKRKHQNQYHEPVDTKAKHGTIQTGSGILTREQPIPQHVHQSSAQTQNVPIQYIEDAKGIIRQWQEAYQNMERTNKELLNGWQNQNKQWEAAYRQLQAWREEDAEYAREREQQLSYLQYNADDE